jgi:hypothetical protein
VACGRNWRFSGLMQQVRQPLRIAGFTACAVHDLRRLARNNNPDAAGATKQPDGKNHGDSSPRRTLDKTDHW